MHRIRLSHFSLLVAAFLFVSACELLEPPLRPTPAPLVFPATETPWYDFPVTITPLPDLPPTVQPLPPTLPPAPPASPTPSGPSARRVQFATGSTSAQVQGKVSAGAVDRYVLKVLAGQTMIIKSTFDVPLRIQVAGENGEVYKMFGSGSADWTGQLRTTQDYYIEVAAESGGIATYTLNIVIPPLNPPSAATSAARRIQFQPGNLTSTSQGSLTANGMDVYVVLLTAQQRVTVRASSTGASLLMSIAGVDGNVLKSSGAGGPNWSGTIPKTQDYEIRLTTADGAAAPYSLEVTVSPVPTPTKGP